MKFNHKVANRHNVETLMVNGHAVVVLPMVDGFAKLVAYFNTPQGEYKWVHKDFRTKRKSKKKKNRE